MKIIFAFLIIILLAFSGYNFTFRRLKIPFFARMLYLTGTEFLVIGILLGPFFFNLLDEKTYKSLYPMSNLILGWAGLLFGFQFEISKLKRFKGDFFLASMAQSLVTFAIVFSGLFFLLSRTWVYVFLGAECQPMDIKTCAILGAAASCTAQTGIAMLSNYSTSMNHAMKRFLQYVSGTDGLVAMIVCGFVYFLSSAAPCAGISCSFYGLPDSGLLAIVCLCLIALFLVILAEKLDSRELLLVVIGMIIFTSGVSLVLNFSSLVTCFIIGIFIVNLSKEKERIFNLLVSMEKPAYLLLLVFLGARLGSFSLIFLPLAGLYFILRISGKILGGFLIGRFILKLRRRSFLIGYGLLEHGGLAFAILLDFHQKASIAQGDLALGIAFVAIFLTDLLSFNMLRYSLQKAEE